MVINREGKEFGNSLPVSESSTVLKHILLANKFKEKILLKSERLQLM